MDKNITKLNTDNESQVSGGRSRRSVYGGHKPGFKHPMNIDYSLVVTKRSELPEGEDANPKPVFEE